MFTILVFIACGLSFYTIIKPQKPEQHQYIPSKQLKITPASIEQKGN
ncbi:hypothetical protein LG329_12340 [Virgibacillus necropolis]